MGLCQPTGCTSTVFFVLLDGALSAYRVYQYSVRVINSAGATSSPYVEAQTLEAAPTGVAPPNTRINPDQLYIIYLTWALPQQPNGSRHVCVCVCVCV